MAIEIERKFLLSDDSWRRLSDGGIEYRQGYLHGDSSIAVRVRVSADQAWLTIKGAGEGITHLEFEYSIPLTDANCMLDRLCRQPPIEKRRYRVPVGTHTWEIDVFHGANQGLVLAEIELASVDEQFDCPDWLGEEVSDDPRYYNAYLYQHPFSEWPHEF